MKNLMQITRIVSFTRVLDHDAEDDSDDELPSNEEIWTQALHLRMSQNHKPSEGSEIWPVMCYMDESL